MLPAPSVLAGMAQADLQTLLIKAQAAWCALKLGTSASELVTQGDVIKFRATKAEDVEGLIAMVQAQLAGRPTAGAVGIVF